MQDKFGDRNGGISGMIEQQFIDAMVAAGCAPADHSEIIADDQTRRYRVDGDKPRTKNGVYCLADGGDGFGFGWFINHKEGVTHNWHTKAKRGLSDEEKQAHRDRMEQVRRESADRRKREAEDARQLASDIWGRSVAAVAHPYLTAKGVHPRGLRLDGDTLIVPMYRDARLVSVQRIMPDGGKFFLKNSDHVGAYFSIRGDQGTIAICEGMATGGSISDATGWSVIAAFNAGNLKPVATAIRARYPDARIVICGDNDHETTNAKGEPWNPGRDKAQQAAIAIGGSQVLFPTASPDVTDWNDVHKRFGIDAVRDALLGVPDVSKDDSDSPLERDASADDDPLEAIRPLGHNRGEYYFFPRATGQIVAMNATALGRIQNLFQLAPLGFWEMHYGMDGKANVGDVTKYASAHLMAECQRKGIFSHDTVRGVGAWKDKGKVIVNCGDMIIGDGVKVAPSMFVGDLVYESGPKVISLTDDVLSEDGARRLIDLCRMLSWKKPQYADQLAGWLVVASIGSCLDWRPHCVITGASGSGKSTVMDSIIKGALGDIAVKRDGGTSEAGLRKALMSSGRPAIIDEAESETKTARIEMDKILQLIRKASSGAMIENAYSKFVIRSCFCLAAINPRIIQGADQVRYTQFELVKNQSPDAQIKYEAIVDEIDDLITDKFPSRLISRTMKHIDTLLHNIGVFNNALSRVLSERRTRDQMAPLVAGSLLLLSTKRYTIEEARDWVSTCGWSFTESVADQSDAEALVSHIMASRVRYDVNGMGRESSIGELVLRAMDVDHVEYHAAVSGLGGYGLRVDGGRLIISNTSSPLRRILSDTPWGTWKRTLSDYVGSDNCDGKTVYFSPGIRSRAMSIPLDGLINGDVAGDVDDDGAEIIDMDAEDWG